MDVAMRIPHLALAIINIAGCADTMVTSRGAELKVTRAVLYQNGIGYFERRGRIDEDVLHLRVRPDQIRDFLKSLTVVDMREGRAVSIDFPIEKGRAQQMSDLPEQVRTQGGVLAIAQAFRGARCHVVADSSATGRLIGVEDLGGGDKGGHDWRLSVLDGFGGALVQLARRPRARAQSSRRHAGDRPAQGARCRARLRPVEAGGRGGAAGRPRLARSGGQLRGGDADLEAGLSIGPWQERQGAAPGLGSGRQRLRRRLEGREAVAHRRHAAGLHLRSLYAALSAPSQPPARRRDRADSDRRLQRGGRRGGGPSPRRATASPSRRPPPAAARRGRARSTQEGQAIVRATAAAAT